MRNFVIGGNWKLQINSFDQTRKILLEIRDALSELNLEGIKVFLALPYTTLFIGQEVLKNSSVSLAAQNVHFEESGPFTGEISIESLKELDVRYILIGHSERRIIFGEKDEDLNKKVRKVLEYGLTPVFCIGETAHQRNSGIYKEVLSKQLMIGLKDITQEQITSVVIAYEPVWAINNKLLNPDSEIHAATPEEAKATHAFIRLWLKKNYTEAIASQIPIQYGGSMKPSNSSDLLSITDIDGGLIGGASLSADTLIPIINSAISFTK